VADEKIVTLERQLQRYQALLRSAQRAVGLSCPPSATKPAGGRKRKPAVRALRAISVLKHSDVPPPDDPIQAKDSTLGVCPSTTTLDGNSA